MRESGTSAGNESSRRIAFMREFQEDLRHINGRSAEVYKSIGKMHPENLGIAEISLLRNMLLMVCESVFDLTNHMDAFMDAIIEAMSKDG